MPAFLDFTDTVTNGRLPERRRRQIRANLAMREGEEVSVTITGPRRSLKANRFYRGVILRPIVAAWQASGTPMIEDLAHDYFKHTKLPDVARLVSDAGPIPYVEEWPWPNGVLRARYTTRLLDRTAFSYFVSAVMWSEEAMRLGVEFDVDDSPDGILLHPDVKGSRVFNLETDGAPLYDAGELPDYTPADVVPRTMADL